MGTLPNVILENKAWVAEKMQVNPDYFTEISKDQTPFYLWVGCSDSRVNPNEITGTGLGDMFVHRNIANLVHANDLNLMSVMYYGITYLGIKHVIICGHYGCGGVMSAMSDKSFGLIDGWLLNIKNVISRNKTELSNVTNEKEKVNMLVEMNVIEQVKNLSNVDFIKAAIKEKSVTIHGWVYDMNTGYLKQMITLNASSLAS